MGEQISHNDYECIRKSVSGTSTAFIFDRVKTTIMVDVLGSNGVYANIDASVSSGINDLYIPGAEARSFDLKAGSVNLMVSGSGVESEVQVIGLS